MGLWSSTGILLECVSLDVMSLRLLSECRLLASSPPLCSSLWMMLVAVTLGLTEPAEEGAFGALFDTTYVVLRVTDALIEAFDCPVYWSSRLRILARNCAVNFRPNH